MDDLISRQEAIDALEKFEKQCWEDMCFRPLMSDARVIIKCLPAVEPDQSEQKTGVWIDCPFNNLMDKRMMCDQCGSVETNLNHANFCPNCGEKDGKADRLKAVAVKFFNDPYTGKLFTTCSCCGGKISTKDNYCKHCGARIEK